MFNIDWQHRPTTEIVVLSFTMLICVTTFMLALGIIIARIVSPAVDLSKAAESISNMLSTIIGALVGFISGRVYGRKEERLANGQPT